MALNFPTLRPRFLVSLKKNLFDHPFPSSLKVSALSEGTESRVKQDQTDSASGPSTSARTRLDLLEQLTSGSSSVDGYESDGGSNRATIREQLANLFGDRDGDFSIPLGKNLKKATAKFLTISQKRNIKRQTYLNEVSQRNDSNFFATIGAFVLLPPIVILGIAIATDFFLKLTLITFLLLPLLNMLCLFPDNHSWKSECES